MDLDTLTTRLAQLDKQRAAPLKVLHLCWPCQQALRAQEPRITTEFLGKTIIEEALGGVTRCLNCRWVEYIQGH